ncbi:MAG: tyrosine--tRNA ligase, partial [Candidatus Aenigmatarchaeota archaeon]
MDTERRMELITRAPTEEVITPEDLRKLLEAKSKVTAYDGFEPSGLMHIGTALLRALKIQDMLEANVNFTLLVADWFAWLNGKMGGDLELIKKTGEYFVEGWKACGVDTKKVKVVWTSDIIKDPEYWKGVLRMAKMTTVQRAIRAGTIMGRKEAEMQYTAQLIYPMMQGYDPFYLNADILQLGMDQRKATVLTRELAPKVDGSIRVCVHHHLLAGLTGPARMGKEGTPEGQREAQAEAKMSKSKPKSAIFIHDTPEQIEEKIKEAFAPPKQVEGNAILEICKYIIFKRAKTLEIKRPTKFGGDLSITDYAELEKAYTAGELHPADLKPAVAQSLADILAPVRAHFEKNKNAKKLYETVRAAKITR